MNRLNLLKKFVQNNEIVLAFLSSFVILMILHNYKNVVSFYYDSGFYWHLASNINYFKTPEFLHYRGYVYPLLLSPARYLAHGGGENAVVPYRIYSSLIFGFGLSIILPSFYISVFGGKTTYFRRLIPSIFIALFFSGLIIYPLSDLPAFLMLVGSLHLLLKFLINFKDKWSLKNFCMIFGSGFFIGAAYNTRTIYLFSIIAILLASYFVFKSYTHKLKLQILGAFMIGLGAISLPQAIMNYKAHGIFTPTIIMDSFSNKSLFALQSIWGITVQRYETNIDSRVKEAPRFYIDKSGVNLFEKEKITPDDISLQKYISLVLQNPMHFIGTYTRHVVSGLDLRDGEVYVRDALKSYNFISFLNFILIFIGLWILFIRYSDSDAVNFSNKLKSKKDWPIFLILLLLPVAAIVPGAVETRFFAQLHLLLYSTIAFNTSGKELLEHFKKNKVIILSVMFILFSLFSAISLNTIASLQNTLDPKYQGF